MGIYRTKPEYVEAFQYDGDLKNREGNYYVPDWAVKAFERGDLYYEFDRLYLNTYGEYDYSVFIKIGDWIVCRDPEDVEIDLDVYDVIDFFDSFDLVEE